MDPSAACSLSFDGGPPELLNQLMQLQCPFTWDMPDNISVIEKTLEEAECSAKYFKEITNTLLRSFEYVRKGDLVRALEVVQGENVDERLDLLFEQKLSLEEKKFHVVNLEDSEAVYESEHKVEFDRIPYYHVFFSCECFVLYSLKRFDETRKVFSKIVPFDSMSSENQTIVYCLKADLIKFYGYNGQKRGLEILDHALMLYPKSSLLLRELGILLGKVRRIEDRSAAPDFKREIEALESKLRESYDHKTAMFLAVAYRDYAKSIQFSSEGHGRDMEEFVNDLNQKAADLYCKAYAHPDRDYHLSKHLAEGFTRLPPPWRDLEKAKVCLEEALDVCKESSYLNHVAGNIYTKTGDLEQAKHYLLLASKELTCNYGACMDLIYLKQKEDPLYCPISDFKSMLEHIKDKPFIEAILCSIGAIFYFKKKNFEKAFEYWSQVVDQNIESKKLKFFSTTLIQSPRVLNINKIVIKEIQKKVANKRSTEKEEAILGRLLALYPNLREAQWEMHGRNQCTRKQDLWWKKKPVAASGELQKRENTSWRQQDSPSAAKSDSTPQRRQLPDRINDSISGTKFEHPSHIRPGSRFGREEVKESWRSNFKSSSAPSKDASSSKGTFWRQERSSLKSPEGENWRRIPRECCEGDGQEEHAGREEEPRKEGY